MPHLLRLSRVSDFANFAMETNFPNSSGIHNKMAHRQMAPYFWKPWMADYVAAGFFFQKNDPKFLEALNGWLRCRRRFFFQKNCPHISGSPERLTTLPQALFLFRKIAPICLEAPPYFWKPLTADYVAAGAFFFQKNGPHLFGSPTIFLEALNGWLRCRRRFFFPEKWPPYFWKPRGQLWGWGWVVG